MNSSQSISSSFAICDEFLDTKLKNMSGISLIKGRFEWEANLSGLLNISELFSKVVQSDSL